MPVAKVKAPDGQILKVSHPEGATGEEIIRNAEILFSRKQQAQASEERARKVRRQQLRIENPGEYDPRSPEFRERFGAASDSFVENVAAGSGKAVVDTGRGLRQLAVEGANLVPGVDLAGYSEELRERATESRNLDAELMGTGGGLAGNITTNVGLALAPGGLASGTGIAAATARSFSAPTSMRAALASGAVQGAIQPVGSDESRTFNAATGATLGAIGNKIGRPFTPNLSRGQASAVDTLSAAGVPLDVAERTGSLTTQRIASMLDDSVVSAGARQNFKDGQMRAFTKAVLGTIGESAEEATPAVMRSARTRISGVFDDIARSAGGIRADARLLDDAQKVYRTAQNNLLSDEMRLFDRNFMNVFGAIDGNLITPSRFNSSLSQLSKLSTRPNVGQFATDLEEILLDALGRSNPGGVTALNSARSQWRNLRLIQGAIDKGESRLISPLRLSNTLSNKANQNLSVFGMGRNESLELANLARAGREILKESANSGTPLRQQIPTGAALTGATMLGGVPGLLGSAGAIRGAAGAINSQGLLGSYLVEGLPQSVSTPLTQMLIRLGLLQQPSLMAEPSY